VVSITKSISPYLEAPKNKKSVSILTHRYLFDTNSLATPTLSSSVSLLPCIIGAPNRADSSFGFSLRHNFTVFVIVVKAARSFKNISLIATCGTALLLRNCSFAQTAWPRWLVSSLASGKFSYHTFGSGVGWNFADHTLALRMGDINLLVAFQSW